MAKRSNCLIFALWMWCTRGGYLAVRTSHHITGWHWLWSPDLRRWLHYEPIKPCANWWCGVFHKVYYVGVIVRGDPAMEMLNVKTRKPFWLRARDAITGRFLSVKDALKRRTTTIIERIKRAKRGDFD